MYTNNSFLLGGGSFVRIHLKSTASVLGHSPLLEFDPFPRVLDIRLHLCSFAA